MRGLLDGYAASLATSEGLLASTFEAEKRAGLLEGIRSDSCDAGLLEYGLGAPPAAIRRRFERAADAALELFRGGGGLEWKTPATLLEAVWLALIADRELTAVRLAEFGRYPAGPFDSGGFFADELVVAHVNAICACVRAEPGVSIETAELARRRARGSTAPFAGPLTDSLTALIALERRDGVEFSSALMGILDWQAQQSTLGQLREDTRGLMSIGGLALARLGLGQRVELKLDSPYLPLELLAEG